MALEGEYMAVNINRNAYFSSIFNAIRLFDKFIFVVVNSIKA